MANIGWIKLHRSILDWEWYEDKNTTRLLIHLLASVNHEDKKWKGKTIKAGSMAFSWDTLSLKCGLSKQQLRTSMGKLESSNEVTRNLTGKYQLVSLCKWEELQGVNSKVTAKPTDNQQKNNSKVTPTKEEKKLKKERREKLIDSLQESKTSIFNDWLNYRKSIKKSITVEATIETLVNRFNKETLDKCKQTVNSSIENGYTGLFWDKFNNTNQSKGNLPTEGLVF